MKNLKLFIIASTGIVVITLLVLVVFGVFKTKDTATVTVLNRPNILSKQRMTEPETLSEFLNAEVVSLKDFFGNEKVMAQLSDAEELTEVVDSRLSLTNLRILQQEVNKLSEEIMLSSMENSSASVKPASLVELSSPVVLTISNSASVKPASPVELLASAVIIPKNSLSAITNPPMLNDTQVINTLKGKLDTLLAKEIAATGAIKAQIDFKGVWTDAEEVILHWTPHGDWIPDNGYSIYRTVNGKTDLIAQKLGALSEIALKAKKNTAHAEYIENVFGEATLTADKMSIIGITSLSEFPELVYKTKIPNSERLRIAGDKDFIFSRDRLLTIPGTLEEKLPQQDAVQRSALTTPLGVQRSEFSITQIKLSNQSLLSIKPGTAVRSYDSLAGLSDGQTRIELIERILEARKSIIAKTFTDISFAYDAGFSLKDSLKSLNLAGGTSVTYRLEGAPGQSWTLQVTTGTETVISQPAGLAGYGIDNIVSLRWQAPVLQSDKSLISGYYIERKKNGEKDFIRLNGIPTAISYNLDETGIFFESPVFFQDTALKNGEIGIYRIQALDIFGRTSEYSDELEVAVYKITPPNSPNMDQPLLSKDSVKRADAFYQKLSTLNSNVNGIIIPIAKTSADTQSIVVYRARALGTGLFDLPVEIGRVVLDTGSKETVVKTGQLQMLLSPASNSAVDLAYFDGDITPGYTYKYWSAAVDDWGNESVWSGSRIIGVPLNETPKEPENLSGLFLRNDLPDLSNLPAGFGTAIIDSKTYSAGKKAYAYPSLASDVVLKAEQDKVKIGVSLSSSLSESVPSTLSSAYGNLPNPDMVHAIIALENSSILPDSSLKVSWVPFSGNGFSGYHIYRAEADSKTIMELSSLSREEILESYIWKLVKANIQNNQLTDKEMNIKDGRIYLYMVCLVPEESSADDSDLSDPFSFYVPGGWIKLTWEKPDDPQVLYYRIYRSEVEKFSSDDDTSNLKWIKVSDQNRYLHYTEKTDQTYAHYYYYKVNSVSIWGIESKESAIIQFRVPAASPPGTPVMLLPLSQKGKIQVNWAGVPHASKYTVYRTRLPKISEQDIISLETNYKNLYENLFKTPSFQGSFLSTRLKTTVNRTLQPTSVTPVLSVDKFNTLQHVSGSQLMTSIGQVNTADKLSVFKNIAQKYGPLALSPYGKLSEISARLVQWEKVAVVSVTEGQDPTAAFKYTDVNVIYGYTYLYTVQAQNEDDLYSAKPSPVSSSPRRTKPFEPITGLKGAIENGKPVLYWDQAKNANLSWLESRRDVAGYIVYRSTEQNGIYYQASPLLAEMKWRDTSADPSAYNWYKVKVVDTAGYLSDFSDAYLIRELPAFIIKDAIILSFDNRVKIANRQIIRPIPPPEPPPTRPAPIPEPAPAPEPDIIDTYALVTAGSFKLTNVSLSRSSGDGSGFLSIGAEEPVEVTLSKAVVTDSSEGLRTRTPSKVMLRGTATLKQPVYLPEAGITLSNLAFSVQDNKAYVEGYLQSPVNKGAEVKRNLLGDLYSIKFSNSSITSDGVISVSDMPAFRWGNLDFAASKNGVINLNQDLRQLSLLQLTGGSVIYHPSLETIDNAGITYQYTKVSFGKGGLLTGKLTLSNTQTLSLIVPAGIGIRVNSSVLSYKSGIVDPLESSIKGKLILPCKTYEDQFHSQVSMKDAFKSSEAVITGFDKFISADKTITLKNMTGPELAELNDSMAYLAYRIQSNALVVLPSDPALQEKYSTVPFNVTQWSGDGFTVDSADMTPASFGKNAEDPMTAIGVTPGKVSVDLDRKAFVSTVGPQETKEPFWLGLIIKEGNLFLPPGYVMTDNNTRMSFKLSTGELLYDLNGFSYQNILYNSAGKKANFGDELGGFLDVRIFDCMIDLYANEVNVVMNAQVGIPLFGYQKANVKLYTSRETGSMVCSVVETDKLNLPGSGEVKIKITSGQLQKDGMHVNGTLDVSFPEKLEFYDIRFNEMIIPSDMEMMTKGKNPDNYYGNALLEQPVIIAFHGFKMEMRALSIVSAKQSLNLVQLEKVYAEGLSQSMKLKGTPVNNNSTVSFYQNELTLRGSMQLSDNIAMNGSDSFDSIVISSINTKPQINYESSKARLDFEFEEFVKIRGEVTPVVNPDDDSIVEYDTDTYNMMFSAARDLTDYDVAANVRIGYDRKNDRHFFALGTYYEDDEEGISIYYGYLNQICGVIGYNIDLPKGPDNRYAIPKGKSALFDAVDSLPVNQTAEGNYFFASTVNIYLYATKVNVCDIRNVYLLVEKGPTIESGGDFYGPFDLKSLVSGNGFVNAGPGRIGYYHAERLFQASTTLYEMPMYTLKVSGDMGVDISSTYFEVRLGYPDALTAKASELFDGRFGITFRYADNPDDSIKAKMSFGYDTGYITISPVYLRGYLNVGAEGLYKFNQEMFLLDAWLNGGVEGGITAFKKHYAIIHLMLNAQGEITNKTGDWELLAQTSIYYSLDLWIDDIEGSVTWVINKSL